MELNAQTNIETGLRNNLNLWPAIRKVTEKDGNYPRPYESALTNPMLFFIQ